VCVEDATSGASSDKALVFGCNDETFAKLDHSSSGAEFGTIVLEKSVAMNITGTTATGCVLLS
jgi:hypothetical protein